MSWFPTLSAQYNLREIYHSHLPKLRADQFSADSSQSYIDLRSRMPPIYDQGQLGSCSANALCAAYAYDNPSVLGSRLFLYFNERSMEGTIQDDSGACLSDGVEALHTYGLCPETMWPYSDDKTRFKQKPPPECYQAASSNEATAYHQVEVSEQAIKACLASGYPIVLGIKLFKSFEGSDVASTGRVPMPQPGEGSLGGHAVCMVGYIDQQRVFIMRNSWGEGWGDKGYFYLPYDYILGSPSYANGDLWTITSVSNAPVSDPPTKINPYRQAPQHHNQHHRREELPPSYYGGAGGYGGDYPPPASDPGGYIMAGSADPYASGGGDVYGGGPANTTPYGGGMMVQPAPDPYYNAAPPPMMDPYAQQQQPQGYGGQPAAGGGAYYDPQPGGYYGSAQQPPPGYYGQPPPGYY